MRQGDSRTVGSPFQRRCRSFTCQSATSDIKLCDQASITPEQFDEFWVMSSGIKAHMSYRFDELNILREEAV